MYFCCKAFVADDRVDISDFAPWTKEDEDFLLKLSDFGWKIFPPTKKSLVNQAKKDGSGIVVASAKDDFGKYKRRFMKIFAPDKESAARAAMAFVLVSTGIARKADPKTVDISGFKL